MDINVLKELNQRPIAYYPVYRNITGSTTAAVLLSQLMYWFSKKNKFHKTNKDLMEETMLSEKELKSAKARIKRLGIIKITLEGVPAKTYYEINWRGLEVCLIERVGNQLGQKSPASWDDSAQLDRPKGPNSVGQKGPTITKTTTETTSDIKKSIKKESSDLFDQEELPEPMTLEEQYPVEKEIFDYWNTQESLITHKSFAGFRECITNALNGKTVDKVRYKPDVIKNAISRLDDANLYENYYYDNSWNLQNFLKQRNGISKWTDEGQEWNRFKDHLAKEAGRPANSITPEGNYSVNG